MSREELLSVQQEKYPALFEIDRNLDGLVRRIELLTYVNPLNVEKEKHRFFTSKYLYEPVFKYPKQNFNPYKLHRLFFAQPLEKVTDPKLYQLFKDVYSRTTASMEPRIAHEPGQVEKASVPWCRMAGGE